MQASLAACHEATESYNRLRKVLYAQGVIYKTQYLLIPAPYTRIVVFWITSNIPPYIL